MNETSFILFSLLVCLLCFTGEPRCHRTWNTLWISNDRHVLFPSAISEMICRFSSRKYCATFIGNLLLFPLFSFFYFLEYANRALVVAIMAETRKKKQKKKKNELRFHGILNFNSPNWRWNINYVWVIHLAKRIRQVSNLTKGIFIIWKNCFAKRCSFLKGNISQLTGCSIAIPIYFYPFHWQKEDKTSASI